MRNLLLTATLWLMAIPHLLADELISTKTVQAMPADPATEMVSGIDRFLLRKWTEADAKRADHWWTKKQFAENRARLIEIIGLESQRHSADEGLLYEEPAVLNADSFKVRRVRWPVLSSPAPQTSNSVGLWGEGLHLAPTASTEQSPRGLVVVIPDADELPEHWLPLSLEKRTKNTNWREEFAAKLAADGHNVIVMATVNRKMHKHRNANISRREYLHRSAFELGRTLTAYEIQSVQALIDRIDAEKVMVIGVGEGGRTALLAGAVDERIDATVVGSYFGQHGPIWSEPLSRQLFGIHEQFSDGYISALIAPRRFYFFNDKEYRVHLLGDGGGAPAVWDSTENDKAFYEFQRHEIAVTRADIDFMANSIRTEKIKPLDRIADDMEIFKVGTKTQIEAVVLPDDQRELLLANASHRSERLFDSIDSYNQLLMTESPYERRDYINIGHPHEDKTDKSNRVDTSSLDEYQKSIERFRSDFRENVVGWFADEPLPLNARSKPAMRGENWTGHEVMLNVFPDVFAYGVLLMPNDIPVGQKRPVVVCQHGLEGRPQDTIQGDHRAYHDFAAKLASEGYIVFAPQNPYIGRDNFRTLQRKAYPIGKTLFSIIGAQHQQIIRYLKTIPAVDGQRIAFYGLSYGGKSAMRLPALLPEYCLSICSADFNDWVWKNASSRARYSYIGTGEYEIFEFGLGKKFNYAEMAALIAPRPFMVERGHFDGVAPDERVAMEFAKVRFLYQARLKLPDHCELEFFDGPHTINGKGTFEFLHRHLKIQDDQ